MEAGGAKAFMRALKSAGLKDEFYLYRLREKEEMFPWSHLDMKVTTEYLWRELEQAKERLHTLRCFDGCKRCGVCQ